MWVVVAGCTGCVVVAGYTGCVVLFAVHVHVRFDLFLFVVLVCVASQTIYIHVSELLVLLMTH